MGGIGGVVARRMALGWGMKVVYHNRKPLPDSDLPKGFEVEYKDTLEGLLAVSDVVSVHVPVCIFALSIPSFSDGMQADGVDECGDQKPVRQGSI
jgi:hypothetical protein